MGFRRTAIVLLRGGLAAIAAIVVFDLAVFLLGDGQTPWSGSHRSDPEFLRYWLRSVGILASATLLYLSLRLKRGEDRRLR